MTTGGARRVTLEVRASAAAIVVAGALGAAGCAGGGATPGGATAPPHPAHDSVGDFLDSHFSAEPWRDDVVRDYLSSPAIGLPLGLAAAALVARPFDRSLQHGATGAFNRRSMVGEVGLGVLVTGSLLSGTLAPGEGRTSWDEGWNQAEAFGISMGATTLLKGAVGRHRPGETGGGTSFPSGHAAAAFTAATLIDRNSGHSLGYPAYGIAAITAFSRVESGRHFPSDVLGGAALGVLAGGMIDALHFGAGGEGHGISGPRTTVGVVPEPGGAGLALVIDF
jgi:hypothetical protein